VKHRDQRCETVAFVTLVALMCDVAAAIRRGRLIDIKDFIISRRHHHLIVARAGRPGLQDDGSHLLAVRVGLDQLEKIITLFDRLTFVEAVNAVAVGVGEPTRDAVGGNS
jgi:hypothetical protein